MLIYKLWGIALLSLSGLLCGCLVVQKQRSHRAALEETVVFLQYIRDEIQYRKCPSQKLLQLLKAQPFAYLDLAHCCSLQNVAPPALFDPEECSRFCACMELLGRSSAQQQCDQLVQGIAYFQRVIPSALERERQIGAIYPKIGLCIAAILALICL